MIFSFQVLYLTATGGIYERSIQARTSEEAEARVRAVENVQKISVGPGQPLIDYAQPFFDLEETAALLHYSIRQVNQMQNAGELPKARNGNPLFPRQALDDFVRRRMQMKEAA